MRGMASPENKCGVGHGMDGGPFQASSGTSTLILLRCIIQKHLWHVGFRITEISAFDATIGEDNIISIEQHADARAPSSKREGRNAEALIDEKQDYVKSKYYGALFH